ncbi:hypothetical protein ACHAWT_003367 [Skeletonema menzelii]|mmetsp:Transcript_2180/g.3586  ORF Transcript_2180/g.3586 Transcript_2180/m.3586 type:complete len:175 (+) Transcript_2180:68-592(+)
MISRQPPPGDLITYAYSLALAESKAKKDAYRSSVSMDPISEDEQPPSDASAATTTDCVDESRRLALHELLKIVDDNKIIIDDRLRRVITGQEETYTSTDAVKSIRRSSTSSTFGSASDEGRLQRPSTSKRGLINRSRRQLGSLFRKSSSRSDFGDKESGDTDVSSNMSSVSSAP